MGCLATRRARETRLHYFPRNALHGTGFDLLSATFWAPRSRGSRKSYAGNFRGVSERNLMYCLTRLSQDVNIVVRTTTHANGRGVVSVSFA
jgi:hypothetical protein